MPEPVVAALRKLPFETALLCAFSAGVAKAQEATDDLIKKQTMGFNQHPVARESISRIRIRMGEQTLGARLVLKEHIGALASTI